VGIGARTVSARLGFAVLFSSSMRLRGDVLVTARSSGLELWDQSTGLRFELPADPPELERLEGAAWEDLQALGLVDEGLTHEQILARQAPFRVAAATQGRSDRLKQLLRFATEKVPFYRQRRSAYAAELVGEGDDLQELPLLRKADVRAQFDALLADGIDVAAGLESGALALSTTSGTTGEKLQVVSDMGLHGYPPNFPWIWVLPPIEGMAWTGVFTSPSCSATECHLGLRTFEERTRGGNTLFLNSTEDLFGLKRPLIENVLEELHRLRPTFLLCNPIYLHWLARRAAELSLPIPHIPVVLSSYQYLPELSRRAIERLLKTKVYDYYAASDLGGCRAGVECDHHRVHVREDQSHLEVLGPDGPLAAGELGAIAVTTVASRVMPLVRYLVGDLGRFTAPCDCPFADWRTIELHGRARDLLRVGERWVTTRDVDQVLAQSKGVDFYRVTQTASDTLQVAVVPSGLEPVDAAHLVGLLREQLGVAAVAVKQVARLDPEESMKFRLTESKIVAPREFL
jgi:phenylacetate-CoA ligase